jgi:hypothetical protein
MKCEVNRRKVNMKTPPTQLAEDVHIFWSTRRACPMRLPAAVSREYPTKSRDRNTLPTWGGGSEVSG